MERKTLARWLVVGALACFGLLWLAGSALAQGNVVQGSNASDTPTAATGTADGSNSTSFSGGPTATGTTGASAQQLGHNSVAVRQSGTAKSGDPVAGAQVTGAVADNVTVQNSNAAINPTAISGDATFTNDLGIDGITVGPVATTDTGTAQASQFGDNAVDIAQSASAQTGDAVGGAQVTGIVGEGTHTVQNQNVCDCDLATVLTGTALSANDAPFSAGPLAETIDSFAQAGQVGSNDAVLSQNGGARSGDSVLGSQVTGIVGGSATVQNSNASSTAGATSTSGDAGAANTAEGAFALESAAGPQAFGDTTQVSQTGDNSVDATQGSEVTSGDALSGAQVTGAVGDEGGFLTVQNQQASEDADSLTGDVTATNDLELNAGPSTETLGDTSQGQQNGDNAMTIKQTGNDTTGDAVAGAQVTGDVGHDNVVVNNSNAASTPIAVSGTDLSDIVNLATVEAGVDVDAGTGTASASQLGNNAVSADQALTDTTGDAVAGAQVTGVVSGGSTVTIANSNASEFAVAVSGGLAFDTPNELDVNAGPEAEDATDAAQAQQTGDNSIVGSQAVALATGDAVAGSQVSGVVANDSATVTVSNQNASSFSVAASGGIDAATGNEFLPSAGPAATSLGSFATTQQNGDNTIDSNQALSAKTGDAVGGAQVTGAVTGDGSTVTIMNSNAASDLSDVTSGSITIDNSNDLAVDAGPLADGTTFASVGQLGDNAVTASQAATLNTGDAVGGAQVTGAVTGDGSTVTVSQQNAAEDAVVTSGTILADDANSFEGVTNIGPAAIDADTSQASQFGDNSVDVSQTAAATTGDAVGGAQVAGVVGGDNSTVTIMESNACATAPCAVSVTGDVTFLDEGNIVDLGTIGPDATSAAGSASASQFGDNHVALDQTLAASSGDAVAGSQVTGVVAGAGSNVTISNQNSADTPIAITGDVTAANDIEFFTAGPNAFAVGGDAQAQQTGNNTLDFGQSLTGTTGDAVAGSQVTGEVGGTATIQVSNADTTPFALSGDTALAQSAAGNLTATATSATDNAQVSQNGNTTFDGAQDLNPTTGDAVAGAQVGGQVGA